MEDVLNKSSNGEVLNNNREGVIGVPNDILNDNSEGDTGVLLEVYDQVRCQDCGKVFNNKQYLSQHVTKVLQLRDCTCDTCGKSFLTPRMTNKLYFSGYRLTG